MKQKPTGNLSISNNKLTFNTGKVTNISKFIDTNYFNYLFNNIPYKVDIGAKVLPFNLLINDCKQIDTVNFSNKNTPIKNTDLVSFNSIQKSKYYYMIKI